MSDNIKVSIIMPVYKVEEYVGKAIESIQAQTLKEWEFIIVDDGTPDKSGEICDAYAAKDDRITSAYMGGVNAGDGRHFIDAQGNKKRMYLSNWYMPDIVNEGKITFYCTMASILGICAVLAYLVGGVAI